MVCMCVCVCNKDMGHRSGYPAEVGRQVENRPRASLSRTCRQGPNSREGFSRVSTTAAAASMGGDTKRQLRGRILVAAIQIRISVLEVWILQQSPKRRWQVRGRGGRGESRVGKALSGGMMSLALHTRLHWDCLRKKCCLSKVQSFCPPPRCLGGKGASLGRFLCPPANGRAPRMHSSGPELGQHVARALPLPGLLCHQDRCAQTAR